MSLKNHRLAVSNLLLYFLLPFCLLGQQLPFECNVENFAPRQSLGKLRGMMNCEFFDLTTDEYNEIPIVTIPVVFHFRPDNTGDNFICNPPGVTIFDAENIVYLMMTAANGDVFDSPSLNDSGGAGVPDTRIRLALANITSNTACNGIWIYNNPNSTLALQNNVINIVFDDDGGTGGGTIGGFTFDVNSDYIGIRNLLHYAQSGTIPHWLFGRVIAHEVGHILNLPHSFSCDNTCYDFDNQQQCNSAPYGDCDGSWGSWDYSCTWGVGNNLMGYNGAQVGLTRCQWETMMNHLWNDPPTYIDWCSDVQSTLNITTSTTWDGPKIMNRDVVVKSGATLTITCEVRMGAGKVIKVEKGGKLIVDGGMITRHCDSYWQGIEVLGDPTKTQTASNQGTVELKNGAIIEFANNGITTGTNGITWEGGGIIKADNTTFRNNRRSIEFVSYNLADNVSYFTDCNFELTTTYPQTTYIGHVTIWDNYGIPFTTCNFEIQNTGVTDKKYGIYTIDAGYQVLTGCEFSGFTGGVYSTNSSTSRTFSVSTSTFSNNALGVYAGSINSISATYNTFNVGQYRTSTYNHGVFVSYGTGYTVQNNSFSGSSASLTPQPVGVLCFNTGDASNVIRDNSYTGLYAANKSDGDNRNSSTPANGLKYLCNLNSSNHSYDFLVTIDPTLTSALSGIATPQGTSLSAAGNTFSLLSTPTGSDFNNLSNHTTQYYHRSATLENPLYTTGITKTLTSGSPGCSSFFARSGGSLSSDELIALQNEYATAKAKYDNESQVRNNKTDNGDTKALLTEVNKVVSTTSAKLEEKLLGISPWLSSDVLEKVLDKKGAFTANFIQKILSANPDALYNFTLQEKMQKTLTADQLSEVKAAQVNSTERSALESRLSQAGTIASTSSNAIIHHYIVTEPVDLKKVREWLHNKNDLESAYQIVESWLQEKNTKEALKALNEIVNQFKLTDHQQKIYEDYGKITALKVKAMDQGRTIANFDKAEVLALVELADRSLGRAGEQAKGILNFFYGYQYVTQQLPFPGEKAESKIHNVAPILEKASLQTLASVQVVPNPASSEVTFKYNLEGQEINQGTLQVVDFTGQVLQQFDLNDNIGEIRWTINHLPSGLYFYNLKNGGKIISSGKLVVNK